MAECEGTPSAVPTQAPLRSTNPFVGHSFTGRHEGLPKGRMREVVACTKFMLVEVGQIQWHVSRYQGENQQRGRVCRRVHALRLYNIR